MQFADATKLNGVVITSSPSPMPSARIAMCKPAVPLLQAMPYRRPASAAMPSSKALANGPRASESLASTCSTSSRSRGPIEGWARGIGRTAVCAMTSFPDDGRVDGSVLDADPLAELQQQVVPVPDRPELEGLPDRNPPI